jgi:hypothetical protein
MKSGKSKKKMVSDPVEHWDELLRPAVKKSPALAKKFLVQLRNAKLTFGRRVHCPFLRPFFLSPQEEEHVRRVAETIAAVAERVTMAALEDNSLFQQFHLRPPRFAEIHGVQRRVARGSRLFGNHLGNFPAIAGDARIREKV